MRTALTIALGIVLILLPACVSSTQFPLTAAEPVTEPELAEQFNNIFTAGDMYFAGFPTEDGLRALHERGVKTIITLKAPEQLERARGFDERAVADELGMRLVILPISADSFSQADVESFERELNKSRGPVLLHCGSSNTVGALVTAYLHLKQDVPLDEALELGKAAGLSRPEMADAARRVALEHSGS